MNFKDKGPNDLEKIISNLQKKIKQLKNKLKNNK
jgi:hypothetical protein